MTKIKKMDQAISPIYFTESLNGSVQLYKGQLEIENNKTKILLDGIIEFIWLRNPQLRVSFTIVDSKIPNLFESETTNLKIPKIVEPAEIRINKSEIITDEKGYRNEYEGIIKPPIGIGNGNNLSYVFLHLVNFHNTLGKPISEGSKSWGGRFHLDIDDWKITVDKAKNYEELFKSLKKTGGYGITHTFKIEKKDGKLFDIKQLDNLKEELFYFFSFIRGFWTELIFEAGFDKKDRQIWKKFSIPRTDKWQIVSSWFDYYHPEILNEFWMSFRQKLQNPIWQEPLERAIRLYISANQKSGELEGSIILAQTAHEMLSWTKFVTENKLSQDGFKKLPPSDKLKLIILDAKLPSETPSLLKFLINQPDGCKAITEIRNKLVHPEPKHIQALQNISNDEMQDTYILTMWYLELILLYLLGFKGKYYNRLVYTKWEGQTEDVPWN